MIFDRTTADIATAKRLIAKLQGGESLTAAEIASLERGTYTVNSLNRVEGKCEEMKELLCSYFYFCNLDTRIWENGQIFTEGDCATYLNNLQKLINAFYVYPDTPAVPGIREMYGYNAANAIEKILVDIENNLAYLQSQLKQCGNAECGG